MFGIAVIADRALRAVTAIIVETDDDNPDRVVKINDKNTAKAAGDLKRLDACDHQSTP